MENLYEQFQKYFSGEISDIDKTRLESWIKASAENQRLYNELEEIWVKSKDIDKNIILHPDMAWDNITHVTGILRKKKVTHKDWNYISLLKIAASLLFLIGLGIAINITFFPKPEIIIASTINTSKQVIHLTDGTIIYLNDGSQLKYPTIFNRATREVELNGEAFFKVAKDAKHPFIVHANGTNTRVLGTSFDINTKTSDRVCIAVFSGKVAFKSNYTEP